MKKKEWPSGTLWVTGSTSGIGRACVFEWASHGWDVIATGRNPEKLSVLDKEFSNRFEETSLRTAVCDFSKDTQFSWVESYLENARAPHVFIMNAGCGVYGNFFRSSWEEQKSVIRVNFISVILFVRHILEVVPNDDIDAFIFIGSTSGRKPVPYMATYGATKAGLHSFVYALRNELNSSGIRTLLILPGSVETEFHKKARFPNALKTRGMKPEYVARMIFERVSKGQDGLVHLGTWKEKLGGIAQRVFHPWWWARVMGKKYEPPQEKET